MVDLVNREPGQSSGPLEGVRVLDLTSVVMGPMATQLLADQGAEVTVVEWQIGDTNRRMGLGAHPELSGTAVNLMRNKRSVSLDLRADTDRGTVEALVRAADVFVTTLRPGSVRRLNLDYRAVRAINPRIVYARAQGFPAGGAQADMPAYDDIIQAESGLADLLHRVGAAPGGEPRFLPSVIADKVSGLMLAQAITAALYHRATTGEGQEVEVPMVDASLAFLLVEHGAAAMTVPPVGPPTYPRIMTAQRKPHRTADGWVSILPYTTEHYDRLFTLGGADELVGDSRYQDQQTRHANSGFLYAQIGKMTPAQTTKWWVDNCTAASIPVGQVATISELIERLPVATHPAGFDYRVAPTGARFSATPSTFRRPAPLVGADTEEVLGELWARRHGTGV